MPSLEILITGGAGFLARAVARRFARFGNRVTGIGHATWSVPEARAQGYAAWHTADISLEGLAPLQGHFDVVVHCAANSSVSYSLTAPLEAYRRTVDTTAQLLEHLRRARIAPRVVYPSSAAVYGAADDSPLRESAPSHPVSPYGYHKRIVEDLLLCYERHFDIPVSVIRFFSVYGAGLDKQLLWDASKRLRSGIRPAVFWGTGGETRDWIHVEDAAALVEAAALSTEPLLLVNGAAGERVTVSQTLHMLRDALGLDVPITFNGQIKPGDPRFYHADIARARALGWSPSVPLQEGLKEYAKWVVETT
jgi:UDP-glucose 4-epimerase